MSNAPRWEWSCQIPKKKVPLARAKREEVESHPLKGIKSSVIPTRGMPAKLDHATKTPSLVHDPLMSALDGVDPLSALAAQSDWDDYDTKTKVKEQRQKIALKSNPWNEQKVAILNKYTTTKKLSMATGIIAGLDRSYTASSNASLSKDSKDPSKDQPTTIRHRLEQLDEELEHIGPKEVAFYSQQEFVDNLKELCHELTQAWQQDFRVKALKIAIQCSKLLVDTSVVPFYPSKFVLITDILDEFGHLVYERLWSKADVGKPHEIPISESAKETCKNWFYKIASIRELIPRLYVEAAVLNSYNFLDDYEFSSALRRLVTMVRGIGDPLIAAFTRCYLVRIAMSINNVDKQLLKENFSDFLKSYGQILSCGVLGELNKNKVDVPTYLQSYIPAVEWMLVNLVKGSTDKAKDEILEACCCLPNKGLLLHCILKTFGGDYISRKAAFFIQQIDSCSEEYYPLHVLMSLLGESLDNKSVPDPQEVLEDGLKIISQITDPSEYLSCVIAWNSFITSQSTVEGLNNLLEDVIAHVSVGDRKSYYSPLQDIILSIVKHTSNNDVLFTMDKFLPLLDLFGSDEMKAQTARKVLDLLGANQEQYGTTDPVTINSLIFLAKILHDSVNVLTVDDERRQIGNLISHIIRKIDFGLDFEKQLSFYVDARATFTNLDSVTATLVHCVNRLAMETGKKVKSQHTKKTSSFVHACSAYSFITIPSIRSDTSKLLLYLATTQVALFNQCLGQADACINAAIELIAELPSSYELDGVVKSNEPFIEEYVRNALSTLLVLPDCPEQGVLHVVRILVNVLQKYSNNTNVGLITSIYLYVLDLLAASAQPEFPYHVKGVDSNDILYGSDPKFILEINKMCTVLLEQILTNLQKLGANEEYKKQSHLAYGLFTRVVFHTDLDATGMSTLALQLWKLAIKQGCLDARLLRDTVRHLEAKSCHYPPKSALPVLAIQLNGTLSGL